MKKILVITPRFPLPAAGACEQDRLEGIRQWKRMGFHVRVAAKIFDFQNQRSIDRFSKEHGIPVDLIPYENPKAKRAMEKIVFYLRRLLNPLYWDGAAYEYAHPGTRSRIAAITDDWRPDLVCFDYTYLWPLYPIFKKRAIPIITRSINFEPIHFLQEDGRTFLNFLKFFPKVVSELITLKKSDVMFAITPKEEKLYTALGAKNISTLPLRALPLFLDKKHMMRKKESLNIFFFGSVYTVIHNRKALEMILMDIAPELEKRAPGKFTIHIMGRKFPTDLSRYLNERVIYHGYVDDIERFLETMDIALIPSLLGAGMQQKIFEPLSRGIPLVTSRRGLAGYSFEDERHLLLADTADEFVRQLLRLCDIELRRALSQNSQVLARTLFSMKVLDGIILNKLTGFV